MNKIYVKLTFAFLFLGFSPALFSQNIAVNLSGNSGNSAAILDLSDASNSSLGFLMTNVDILNVNSANPISSPPIGLIVWNTNNPTITSGGFGAGFYYWSGTKWFYLNNSGNASNVSGSGTANYIARWISPTTLGTGVAQDNGTGVGISATVITPASLLDVKGNVTIGTYAGINAAPANGMIVSGQVGMGTNSPNASAQLDVTSSTLGLLLPRMTTTQRNAIGSPAQSLLIYNTTDSCFETYIDVSWQKIWCNGVTCVPTLVSASASPNPICTGGTLTLTANATGATAWNWSGPNSFHSSSQNPTISNITPAGTGTYTLTASNACGPATPVTFSLTVDPGVPSSVTATAHPNPICAGDTLTLTGGGVNVSTWSWSGPNSFSSNLQSPTIANIIVADSGKYTLTASNACGPAAPVKTASVKVNTIPAVPATPSGSATPPVSSPNTYTVAAVPGALSYTWSTSNTTYGAVTAGQGTTTATITTTASSGTFTICVHDSDACGISTNSCLTVTSSGCSHNTISFNYTGSQQGWTVPACISQITLTVNGAQGSAGLGPATRTFSSASAGGAGGLGGEATGVLTVIGGSTIYIYVGGQTSWNGGGDTGTGYGLEGGFGGGATDIRYGGNALADRVIVGGGGGGGGGGGSNSQCSPGSPTAGGAGGAGGAGANGGTGSCPGGPGAGVGGTGGSLVSGGSGGSGGAGNQSGGAGGSGNLGTGGNAGGTTYPSPPYWSDATGIGGGGGGGYYGGGGSGGAGFNGGCGAPGGGGGGGSSYIGGVSGGSTSNGANSGNGSATIQY